MPRPKGSPNKIKRVSKDTSIYVRVSLEEKELLQHLAEEKNLTISKYAYNKIFDK